MAFRMTLALRDELKTWVDFSTGLNGGSATGYINAAIERDMEGAAPEVKEAYEAFLRALDATRDAE